MLAWNNKKNLTVVFATLFFLFAANRAFTANVTFIKEYTYQASEIDSKVSSRTIALEQVKRLLLEELGTYLISETQVRDFRLTKDQITTLTAGIVSAEITEEKWDGKTYYLKANITADPKEVAKSVDTLRKNKEKSKELEESRKKAEEALREIERLKKELETVKADTKKQREYTTAVKGLSAQDWFDKGYALGMAGNYQAALEAFGKTIELNPQYANAYYNRGVAYQSLGNIKQAIKDFDRAIELNPQDAEAYYNRGVAYDNLGNIKQAIKDYDRAIELNPQDAEAYYNRGIAYANLGNDKQAIENFKIAARLGHKAAQDLLRSMGIQW